MRISSNIFLQVMDLLVNVPDGFLEQHECEAGGCISVEGDVLERLRSSAASSSQVVLVISRPLSIHVRSFPHRGDASNPLLQIILILLQVPGGSAANVAKGLALFARKLGGHNVRFVGMIGQDALGAQYKEGLRTAGVDPCLVESTSGAPTAQCLSMITGKLE